MDEGDVMEVDHLTLEHDGEPDLKALAAALTVDVGKPPRELGAAHAEALDAMAASRRALAQARQQGGGNPLFTARDNAEAAGLEALAAALRDSKAQGYPPLFRGNGNEVTPSPDVDRMSSRRLGIALEVQGPAAAVAADATLERLKLAEEVSGLALALETAQDPAALVKLLAHEVAAGHVIAMKLFAAADADMVAYRTNKRITSDAKEPVRNAFAGARVMDAVVRAAVALDKVRNGGSRQTIVVVKDGGQAVVAAGSITTGTSR